VNVRSSCSGLLLAIALTASVRPSQARPEDAPQKEGAEVSSADRERSRAAFRRGVTQLRAQDFRAARASFEEAWSLVQHPSILLNLGIARLRTDDPVLAEQDLVRFLSEDPGALPDELSGAREALAEARAKIGTLRVVTSPPSARVSIDGKPVAVRAPEAGATGAVAEARLKAGKHAVVIEAEGFVAEPRAVLVTPKSESELVVTLSPAPASPSVHGPSRTRSIVGWSLAGLSGVALIASGTMALEAVSLSSDYGDVKSKSFQNPSVKSEGIAYRTGADLAFIAALLAGAGAIVLLFTDVGSTRFAFRRTPKLALRCDASLLHW
jgi:hypothetical protein